MVSTSSLRVPTTGVCAGHRCDDCPECVEGICCGADVDEAWNHLPAQGSWPNMVGTLGVWDTDGDGKLACHVCGKHYLAIGIHAYRAHGITAETYRAYFGFSLSAPLVAVQLIPTLQANGKNAPKEAQQAWADNLANVRPSREQLSVIAYRRESRAEVRAKRLPHLAKIRAKGLESFLVKMRDPIFSGQVRAKRIKARRRHKLYDQRCPYCGYTFCAIRYKGSIPVTCRSTECRKAALSAAGKAKAAKARQKCLTIGNGV